MKILHVIEQFKPAWDSGGMARVCYEQTKRLIDRGHEVTVFTTDGYTSRLPVEKNKSVDVDGVEVYYFRNISTSLIKIFGTTSPYYFPFIAKNKIKDFDVIHIHAHRTPLSVITSYYARKNKVPYIVQSHGSVLPFFAKQRLKNIYDSIWGYEILRNASKVIALTNTEVEQYKKMGVKSNIIKIVPNGIDLRMYENLPNPGSFRKKYRISDGEKIVLYVGRLHESKGIDLLIRAFSDILKKLSNAKLVIVGPDDSYKSKLVELIEMLNIKDKVLFTGFVSHTDKIEIFIDSDVFITPRFSGFPITFLEAIACGIPIITTENGDNLDWIDDKVGYVTDYNQNQLNNMIYKILEYDAVKKNFRLNAKKLLEEKFNYDVIIEGLEKIYSDCVKF